MLRTSTALVLSLAALPAMAQAPSVVVDTAPLHSLVSRVMAGLGTPALLLPPGTSPHDFQLRPSDAARLQGAQVVIWTGEGLAPWLVDPLASLAPDAVSLEMLDTEGWTRLALREDAAFAHEGHDGHDHGEHHADDEHADDHGSDHGHEDHGHGHDDADHEDDAAAEDHAGHDHAHGHDGTDPHAWLDPAVAAVWLGLIADSLATADPANAAAYRANAEAGIAELTALQAELSARLTPVAGQTFIVPHDAYQYFEVAFGLTAAGAITLSDAASPGPARIAELRDQVTAGDIGCILTDPQTSPAWTEVLRDDSLARTALVDADGTGFAPGPDLYPQMMRAMADALVTCLTPTG